MHTLNAASDVNHCGGWVYESTPALHFTVTIQNVRQELAVFMIYSDSPWFDFYGIMVCSFRTRVTRSFQVAPW